MLTRIKEAVLCQGEKAYMYFQTKEYPYPPIFIVGFIRSGTTIVYQYLNAQYKFAFFPNVARYHNYKHPFLSTWLHRCHLSFTPNFESEYGHIKGKCAPCDGWEIFHRWFSYYMKPGTTHDLNDLKKIITAFEHLYQAPFLNKNNSNTLRLIELNLAFPDAIFIHVQRDIYSTVASVLKGRQQHNIPKNKFWGVAPDIDLKFDTELDLVVFQYLFCRKFVDKACTNIKTNFIKVDYEEFCKNPQSLNIDLENIYPPELLKSKNEPIAQKIKDNTVVQQKIEIDESVEKIQSQLEIVLKKTFEQLQAKC